MKLAKRAAMAFALLVSTSAWATAEKVVEVAQKASPDLLDKVGGYMQKMYEAAMPIAQKAWQIGMWTLQIDAASQLIPALLILIASSVATVKFGRKAWAAHKHKEQNAYYNDGGFAVLAGVIYIAGAAVAVVCLTKLLQVWLWVKLFVPELWLAHAAIEKLMQ